jgi:hypothetical protein
MAGAIEARIMRGRLGCRQGWINNPLEAVLSKLSPLGAGSIAAVIWYTYVPRASISCKKLELLVYTSITVGFTMDT